MPGIFISYRRTDSDGWAGRLRDALRVRFGDIVFQDVDNIADGEIFSEVIDRALQACDVALVIIGPTWASARDEQGRRRLDLEEDWVRTETAMVLNRKIRVIPVLVGGARLPRAEELPEELRSLTKRQAREIRSTSWDSDVALLASHLEHIVGSPRRKLWLYAAPAVIAAAVLGVFFGARFFGPSDTAPSPAPSAAVKGLPADKDSPQDAVASAKPQTSEKAGAEPQGTPGPKSHVTEVKPAPVAKDAHADAKPPAVKAPPAAKDTYADAKPPAVKAPPAAKDTYAEAKPPAIKPPAVVAAKPAASATESSAQSAAPRVEPRPPATLTAEAPPVERSDLATAAAPSASAAPKPPSELAKAAESTAERASAERSPTPAAAPTGVTAGTVARVVPINLPNRPPSARELRIGDSWTYRLRELTYNKNLATVTHEIRGGDASGIREVIRTNESRPDADGGGTQRRLPLEPRMFEQQIEQNATLFEFAPFLTAFSDVQPGLAWNAIAVPAGSAEWRMSGKVTGRERVRTPAGTFDAIKAELQGRRDLTHPPTRDVYNEPVASHLTYAIWYVPEIGRAVKYDRRMFNRASRLLEHEQYRARQLQLEVMRSSAGYPPGLQARRHSGRRGHIRSSLLVQ